MEITATKEFVWDCAHMLAEHEGLCRNLHGHTYKLQVTVAGELQEDGPSAGMVVDFKDLKEVVRELIVDPMDHATIVQAYSTDPFEEALLNLLLHHDKKRVVVNYRPTAENMVKVFYDKITEALNRRECSYRVVCLRLYETPTSYAEYK